MTIVVVEGTTVARVLVLVRGDVVINVVVVDGFPMRGFGIGARIEPELSGSNQHIIYQNIFSKVIRHTFHSVEGMK